MIITDDPSIIRERINSITRDLINVLPTPTEFMLDEVTERQDTKRSEETGFRLQVKHREVVTHELVFGVDRLSHPQLINVLKRSIRNHVKKIERKRSNV